MGLCSCLSFLFSLRFHIQTNPNDPSPFFSSFLPLNRIPTTTTPSGNSIVDWDCADAVDLPALAAALAHTRRTGVLLAGTGTVDRNPVGQLEGSDIPGEEGARRRRSVEEGLTAATEKVRRWLRERGERVGDQQEQGQGQGNEERARTAAALTTTTTTTATTITIIIVDGFLLFAPPPAPPSSTTTTPPTPPTLDHPLRAVDSLFDVKLFLPSTYSVIKRRRETRGGYATVGPAASGQQTSSEAGRQAEAAASGPPPTQHDHTNHASENAAAGGFWVDPPGYVDDVVWPAYVRDHAWLLLPPGDGDDAAGTCTGTTTSAGTGDISALLRRVGDGRFVRRDGGLAVAPGDGDGRVGMGQLVEWAVEQVLGGVERMLPRI